MKTMGLVNLSVSLVCGVVLFSSGCAGSQLSRSLTNEEFKDIATRALKSNKFLYVQPDESWNRIAVSGTRIGGHFERQIKTTVSAAGNQSQRLWNKEEFDANYLVMAELFRSEAGDMTSVEFSGHLEGEIPPDPEIPPNDPANGVLHELVWIPNDPYARIDELLAKVKADFHRLVNAPPGTAAEGGTEAPAAPEAPQAPDDAPPQ